MTPSDLTAKLRERLAFDVNQECGVWNIPIDDVDGQLCLDEDRVARHVDAIEAEPVEVYHARLAPLHNALIAAVSALELISSMGGRNDGCDYCAKNAREALSAIRAEVKL
jgi:hypothetical protein